MEGGTKLLNSFIKQDLWDEVRVLISREKIGTGIKAPVFSAELDNKIRAGKDIVCYYTRKNGGK